MTARFGGEEFAVCLPDTNRQGAIMIAQRLRCSVIEVGESEAVPGLSTSIGICWVQAPVDMGIAFDIADRALYQAKLNGRDQVVLGGDEADPGLRSVLRKSVGCPQTEIWLADSRLTRGRGRAESARRGPGALCRWRALHSTFMPFALYGGEH
nr:diguanylate cyclase [Marinicella sp. W31]MDC2875853.1 diguanylate cyclase [Marinicella sp. W31]